MTDVKKTKKAHVQINATTFPDENFRNWVLAQPWITNSAISTDDIPKITRIDVSYKRIPSLTGIEYFTELTELECICTQLISLNVSKNTELAELRCSENHLISLDVSKNMKLTNLECYNNQLTSLNVSKHTVLTKLSCSNNYIPEEELPTKPEGVEDWYWNTQPQYIFDSNAGVKINASTFPDENFRNWALAQAWGADGAISSDDISKTTSIDVCWTEITNLTGIEYFTELTELSCWHTRLTSLDVSKNTKLTDLECSETEIASLDVSKNTELTELSCGDNQLTSLDVSANTKLTRLWCNDNELTSLDVSNNTKLKYLECHNNELTSLDVSNNTKLKYLECYNNLIPEAELPAKPKGVDERNWQTLPQEVEK